MHYDKNGFFYVLDRTNGKFIYGEPIVPGINWTLGLDPETGRPKVNPDMLAQSGGPEVALVVPSLEGAIDWQPLAYNPDLGYIYFMSNNWAMGLKFWAENKFAPPHQRRMVPGADYQQYLRGENTGNFIGFDGRNRKVVWRVTGPAPFWAGAVVTQNGRL
jgi:quinohemoprotein ethanol dehydrogenase